MLEAKAKDLALLRLRNDLARYAPELAPRYNIQPADTADRMEEIVLTEDGEAREEAGAE